MAPEHPFPAALNDVEDVVNYVLARPEEFDLTHIPISGFSAGASLALAVSANLFPPGTFWSLISFYPVTGLSIDPSAKSIPSPEAKLAIPVSVSQFFYGCYVPARIDRRDPRISSGFAQLERFPRRILMITAEWDTLALGAEELAERLRQLPGWHVVSQRMAGCAHGGIRLSS
jgi:acetyl esterase/lipase